MHAFRPFRRRVSLFVALLLLWSVQVSGLPQDFINQDRDLARRQEAQFSGPQTVQTVTSTDSPDGVVTETCTIVLTPQTDADGNQQVVEVKSCTISVSSNGPISSSDSGISTSVAQPAATTTADGVSNTLSSSISFSTGAPIQTGSSTDTGATLSTSVTDSSLTTTAAGAFSTSSAAISVIGTTSVSVTDSVSTTDSVTESTTSTSSSIGASETSTTSSSSSGILASAVSGLTSTSTTSTAQTGTAAADTTASASAAPFTLPGKKLQVLPIGLGVFAGISVIALIVVALVTYERTKYRKAFRQRKLAESGANMGYGGMAQVA